MVINIGDIRRVSATFKNAAGADTDPTTVTVKIRAGYDEPVTYVYGTDAELVKTATGKYYVDYLIGNPGRHFHQWVGTGSVQVMEEKEFYVVDSKTA